jgi:hypothetical protein
MHFSDEDKIPEDLLHIEQWYSEWFMQKVEEEQKEMIDEIKQINNAHTIMWMLVWLFAGVAFGLFYNL